MRPLMGTFVTIRASAPSSLTTAQLELAIQRSFRAIEQVAKRMSFHCKRSDIGRLNRGRAGMILGVHRWTYTVLSKAMSLWQASGGVFDCNIGSHLVRAGLLPGKTSRRSRRQAQLSGPAITLRPGRKILLNRPVSLDLGGIAKGFAVDKAVETLRAHGVTDGVVNAGGDLRVFGSDTQPIWIRRPDAHEGRQLVGSLSNGAIATSAAYFTNDASSDGVQASAIFDTARVQRVVMQQSISVIAQTCMQADALTKIATISGRIPTALARSAKAQVLKL
jgi:thiamine biosynthesis lipoprotein